MIIKLIKRFTYKCLNCNTSIGFSIPQINEPEKMDGLLKCVSDLRCPKCKSNLNVGASDALAAIKEYNDVALQLNHYMENNVELES